MSSHVTHNVDHRLADARHGLHHDRLLHILRNVVGLKDSEPVHKGRVHPQCSLIQPGLVAKANRVGRGNEAESLMGHHHIPGVGDKQRTAVKHRVQPGSRGRVEQVHLVDEEEPTGPHGGRERTILPHGLLTTQDVMPYELGSFEAVMPGDFIHRVVQQRCELLH